MFKKFTVKAMSVSLAMILMIPVAVPVLAEETPVEEYIVTESEVSFVEETMAEETKAEEDVPERADEDGLDAESGKEKEDIDSESSEEKENIEAEAERDEIETENTETQNDTKEEQEAEEIFSDTTSDAQPEEAESAELPGNDESAELPESDDVLNFSGEKEASEDTAEEANEPEALCETKEIAQIEEITENEEVTEAAAQTEEIPSDEEVQTEKAALATTYTSGEWKYELSSGQAILKGYTGGSKAVVVPTSIDGHTVTKIGQNAFKDSKITSVTIPDTILSIQMRAFANCTKLSSIQFNARNCSSVSYTAFTNAGKDASSLTVTFGKNVRTVPENMFRGNSKEYAHVTDVVFSDDVIEIGTAAFEYCKNLKSITWGSGMETIGSAAFRYCESLTSLSVPKSVTKIKNDAFNSTGIKKLTIPENVQSIASNAFADSVYLSEISYNAVNCADTSGNVFRNAGVNASSLTVTFGKGVERIPIRLFSAEASKYARITKVVFSSTVQEIAASAFAYCKDLKSVTIPASVTKIGNGAFNSCSALRSVTFQGRNISFTNGNAFTNFDRDLCLYCKYGSLIPEFAEKYGISYEYTDLGKVQGVVVKNVSPGVKISWKEYEGAAGYIIYRKDGSGSFKAVKRVTDGSITSWTDTGVCKKNGKVFTYRVRAYDGDKKSGLWANKTITRLTGVTLSQAASKTYGKMTVKWTKNEKASGYQIQYSKDKSFEKGNKTVSVDGAETLTKTIGSLKSGTVYYVRVRAFITVSGKKICSGWSKAESGKVR